MEQTYNSFQCLVEKLSRCNDCCNGDFMSYHCPLCPVSKYKPRKRGKVEKHLHVHWNTRIKGNNDVTVYVKICPRCRTIYRYQEWSEGIHNFNNVLFLGLDVCLFLRAGLKNHNAMGRSLAMLEDMLSEKLNHTETEKAYLHFEAMTDHKYRFNCVICGYHPSILIWDTFRKAAFRFAVSDMKTPQSDEVNEEVNIKDFWGNLEKCLILRGVSIDESKRIEISPNYSNWSPWIGENSRKGDLIYNTEYKKCGKACHDEMDEPMPEELIINLLIDEKVTSIRRICRELRIGCDGSAMDMILRLREHSITTSSFDKAYEKVFGRSGGWAVGCCRHGIVYAIKNLLRSESPRDYIDLERSLKHRPNVSISDIAHLLASHGNKTTLDFFYPNAGRLDTVTEDNIRNVEDGNTTYSLPYLTEPINHASGSGINFNPTTGCSDHLSLYDWFHQYNCKKRDETLRRCSIVREIAGIVDTQAVEQLFSSSKRDIYFLNNLSPSNHLFLFRLIYHLRNEKANAIIIAKQKKHFGTNLKFNSLGQVCANYLTEEDNDNEDITEEDNDNEYINEEDNNNDYIHEEDNNNEAIYEAYIVEEEISGQDVGDAISEIYQNQQENVEIEDFEQLKYQSTEYQFLQDIVNTILKDKNKLTREEFQHLQSNVKYCNSVLFAKAEVQRQNLVHVRGSQYGTFQYQGTSNYCGLCCVNNALGIRNEGPIVSINQMDKTADQLWLSMVANPSYGLTIPLEPMRDREGFYSVQVIERVLQDQGFDMLLLNLDETLKALEPSEIAANVWTLLYSQFGMAVLIVRPSNSQHWITIRLEEGVILFLDPSVTAPRIITMEFLGSYIIKNMSTTDGQTGSVYFLSPVNGEDLISNAAVGCTVQDGSEASMNVEDGYPPQNQSRQQFKKPCQKTYDLRENPAQKRRKSYIYEIPKKHRRNEIDPEINRGNGDVNDFKDWEKECSDETEKECSDEVEKECSDELEKECSDESISGNGEEPNGCDKMSALYCSENYGRTLKKLKQVFLCDDSNCTIFLHKRHHGFVRKSSTTYNRERLTHCYGSAVFEKEESCEKLHKSLQDDILYVTHDRQRPYSAWSSQIRGIKDTALQEIFSKSSTLTYAYLYSVACKTAIMIMYTDFKGCTYEETDAICRKTEMHVTEESKKMKNLVRI